MSTTGVAAFDATLQTTHIWLNEICDELKWVRDPHRAYHALRSVLHALHDRLRPEEAAGFAAQLPLLVRGTFYEGWHPTGTPIKAHTADDFLARAQGLGSPSVAVSSINTTVLWRSRAKSVGERPSASPSPFRCPSAAFRVRERPARSEHRSTAEPRSRKPVNRSTNTECVKDAEDCRADPRVKHSSKSLATLGEKVPRLTSNFKQTLHFMGKTELTGSAM